MEIKSDINTANEQSTSVTTKAADFTNLTILEVTGGNLQSINVINNLILETRNLLNNYETMAKRDSENISLLAEQFKNVDEQGKELSGK